MSPGSVAIVTGAARGIGRASALALGRKGFALALVDVRARELSDTAGEVRELGGYGLDDDAGAQYDSRA